MSDANKVVHPQITDAVTQASGHVLGLGPAMAAISAYMGQAQAQSVLAANMVNQQQQLALTSLASTVRNVGTLMAAQRGASAPASQNSYARAFSTESKLASARTSDATADYLGQPVVT
jgi:hypothetical protein